MHRSCLWVWFLLGIVPSVQAETLTILNWEEYLSPDIIERWETKTGHTIKQVYFDSDAQRDSMLANYESGLLDIAIIDQTVARIYAKNNMLVSTETTSALPNLKHVDGFWRERCSQYAVPYMYGTVGIAYRKDKVAEAPSSWWDLLKPDEQLRGHVSLLNESADTLVPALIARGHSTNTDDKDELKQAFLDTAHLLPYILTFEYPITYLSTMPDDDNLHMSLVYGGDHHTHNEIQGTDNWAYVIPKENTVIWTDCMGVLKASRKQQLAFDFINFLNAPEIAAVNSENIYFATPNAAAKSLQSPEFQADKSIYPGDAVLENSYHYEVLDTESLKLRNRIVQALMVKYETQ